MARRKREVRMGWELRLLVDLQGIIIIAPIAALPFRKRKRKQYAYLSSAVDRVYQLIRLVYGFIAPRTYGVMVSTLDFESNNPSSILGMSFFISQHPPTNHIHTVIIFEFMTDSLRGETAIDFDNQRHRRIAVEFQLKMLQLYGPGLGIYCVPSLSDCNIWNGIIFVRQGYFKDARLKFTLHMHQFPAKQPQLFFLSKLHHALVNPVTNELDISSTLAELWCYYSDNMLYNFMKDLRRIFTDRQRLTNRFSYNPAAAELYEANPHQYITKAMQCVSDSLEKMQENEEDWSLKACQPNQETQQIKSLLSEVVNTPHLKLQEKSELFLRRLLQ